MIQRQMVTEDDRWFAVRLSQASSVHSLTCQAVIEVNWEGQWIHGIEIFMPSFNLSRAIQWLQPVPPGTCHAPGCVTYDPEGDAAYLYLLQTDQSKSPDSERLVIAGSHELKAEWRLGQDGSLIEIAVPKSQAPTGSGRFTGLLHSDPFDTLPGP